MIGAVLAAWRHETNRLPPQRPRPARPPGVRTHPHAGRGAVRRRPLPSPSRLHPRGGPPERQPLACPLASGRALPALRSAGPTGPAARLSEQQRAAIDQALREGARAHGFDTDHWTLERITTVIQRLTGTRYHPGHTWKLLRRMGWRLQRPARRAVERDEQAIARWVAEDWP
jgi:transposase